MASKTTIVEYMAGAGVKKADAKQAVELVMEAITNICSEGERLTVMGFGTFVTKQRKAKTGRNPNTGVAVQIPAKSVLTFKAAKP